MNDDLIIGDEIYRLTNSNNIEKIKIFYLYCKSILTFIPRVDSLKDYPSHGIDHSIRIIRYINKFVSAFEIQLSKDEAFLLYLAAWTHDIGCIKGRENHHISSVEILRGESGIYHFLDDEYKTCLNYLILSHRKEYDLNNIPEICDINIRLKYICAIFRLMDALDISSERCPRIVYKFIKESLNPKSRNYWEAHLNIVSVSFYEKKIIIDVYDKESAKDYIYNEFMKEMESINDILRDNGIELEIIITSELD